MATVTLRYVGPHAEGVDCEIGYVAHDVPVEVETEIAPRLLEQTDNWVEHKPAKNAEKVNS